MHGGAHAFMHAATTNREPAKRPKTRPDAYVDGVFAWPARRRAEPRQGLNARSAQRAARNAQRATRSAAWVCAVVLSPQACKSASSSSSGFWKLTSLRPIIRAGLLQKMQLAVVVRNV
jgi:hypothetical protein